MEYNEIKKLINDIGNSNLTSFEMTFPDGTVISMKKDNNTTNQVGNDNADKNTLKDFKLNTTSDANQDYKYITSPMVGTFYLKSSPDKDNC